MPGSRVRDATTRAAYTLKPCVHSTDSNISTVPCSACRGEFLDEIQNKKVLGVFLVAIHSHLYTDLSCDFFFFKLTQPLTVSTVQLLYTVKEKEEKPDRKPYPYLWFKKSIQKPQV